MSSHLNAPFAAAIATVMGPVLFWRGFAAWRERRLILDTPTARVRSMAMGLVEVNGTVESRSATQAAFSGKPCVYWEVEIATKVKDGWNTIHRDQSGHPFYLRDETGLALVYPTGAQVKVAVSAEEVCNGLMLPPCYSDYLRENGSVVDTFARAGMLRFRERTLEEKQRVFVLGSAVPQARVLEISDMGAFAATGTDDPGAVALRASRLRTLDGEVHASIRRGDNETLFIISTQSERALTMDLGWKAAALLLLGPPITLFGLWYWLSVWSSAHRAG